MNNLIQSLINSIPKGHVFDTHTVIQMLIQKHTDDYLVNGRNYSTIELYHASIGKIIRQFENTLVEDLGKAYSKNIKDDFSDCEAWRKK